MELGMIGLGRMGGAMVRRLLAGGHHCVVTSRSPASAAPLVEHGAVAAASNADLVAKLSPPRAVWLMVPAAVTGSVVEEVGALLDPGDVLIDGGNTHYVADLERARALASRGVHYLDVGTSGGVWGETRGYCLMVGGPDEAVARLAPVFATLAPGADAAGRTPGRAGPPAPEEQGWLHCGPTGAGHYVKMVHNGIEYGAMAALAEGLAILHGADAGTRGRDADAETTPLEHPDRYQYHFDLTAISEVWRRGSVIGSWLLDLTAEALYRQPDLAGFAGRVSDSGEGRWTALAAIETGVPAPVLTTALFSRFSSRGDGVFANQVLSAMRAGFGGHAEKPPTPATSTDTGAGSPPGGSPAPGGASGAPPRP